MGLFAEQGSNENVPIRLIQAGVVALATAVLAGVVAVAVKITMHKLAGKKVAILGAQQVGKTTLLLTLRDGKVPSRVSRTVDPARGGTFSLPVGDKKVDFEVPKDVPGNDDLAYSTWKEALNGADYVWYLFRADLAALHDPGTNRMVQDHLDVIKDTVIGSRNKKTKVILIGTFADLSPTYFTNLAEFRKAVASIESIKIGLVRIKNAKLVVGSLLKDKEATALIRTVRSHL